MFRRCRSTKTNAKANIFSRRNNSQIVEKEATIGVKAGQQSSNNNVLQWLEHDAAKDAVPLILAFAGPQKCAALAAVSKHWYDLLHQETTWRVMCEELYKVRAQYNIVCTHWICLIVCLFICSFVPLHISLTFVSVLVIGGQISKFTVEVG